MTAISFGRNLSNHGHYNKSKPKPRMCGAYLLRPFG
jgi:hypothetical protein